MSEIIYCNIPEVISSADQPKAFCKTSGKMCELATAYGYCKVTACIKRNAEFWEERMVDEYNKYVEEQAFNNEGSI